MEDEIRTPADNEYHDDEPYYDDEPWYITLKDAVCGALVLGGVAVGAVYVLVEPWAERVFLGALGLAVLALLHGLRLLSAIRDSIGVIVLMAAVFAFGQVAVQERFQEPFIFWPIAISAWAVIYNHDLAQWVRTQWKARKSASTAGAGRARERRSITPVVSWSRQEAEVRLESREHARRVGLDLEDVNGLFAATAARARELRREYDETDERRRFAAGEIDIDDMQRLADQLGQELEERRRRRRAQRRARYLRRILSSMPRVR